MRLFPLLSPAPVLAAEGDLATAACSSSAERHRIAAAPGTSRCVDNREWGDIRAPSSYADRDSAMLEASPVPAIPGAVRPLQELGVIPGMPRFHTYAPTYSRPRSYSGQYTREPGCSSIFRENG